MFSYIARPHHGLEHINGLMLKQTNTPKHSQSHHSEIAIADIRWTLSQFFFQVYSQINGYREIVVNISYKKALKFSRI